MIAQLLSDLCRDNGENTLANQTELSAKIIILVTALPLFTTIMDIMICKCKNTALLYFYK